MKFAVSNVVEHRIEFVATRRVWIITTIPREPIRRAIQGIKAMSIGGGYLQSRANMTSGSTALTGKGKMPRPHRTQREACQCAESMASIRLRFAEAHEECLTGQNRKYAVLLLPGLCI